MTGGFGAVGIATAPRFARILHKTGSNDDVDGEADSTSHDPSRLRSSKYQFRSPDGKMRRCEGMVRRGNRQR